MVRTTISSLFGSSPVRPLQKHMESVQACIARLIPFMEAVISDNWNDAREKQKEISQLERDADVLKRELRLHMPRSLFMPVSRRDLLEVITMQDKIANKAKDIAGLITGRKMSFPNGMGDDVLEFVKRCIDASRQAQTAINELDELVETGFSGKEINIVEEMIKKLDKIESETDRLQITIRSKLYALEDELPPVHVIFLYKIIEWIGELADLSQRVGSRLELMLAR
ncbi:MAG: TIGR00153 family protein [Gammaproteobacteria bacterium]|nr:MAG: TIGR00153 family protein [Gammaproteobacteria bacterium]